MANTVIGKTKTNIPVQGSDNMSNIADAITADASGNITTKGYIFPGAYEYESAIPISNLPTNIQCTYAHVRISNGKINLIFNFWCAGGASIAATGYAAIGSVNIPAAYLDKIVPYSGTGVAGDYKQWAAAALSSNPGLNLFINKSSTGLSFVLVSQSYVAASSSVIRFEFNLNI